MSRPSRRAFLPFMFFCCLLLSPHASAQRRSAEVWPKVHADRRITFHLKAPKARAVLLEASFLSKPQAMQMDAEGTWSVTTQPLRVGLAHSELFAWIAAFSSAVPPAEQLDTLLAHPGELNENLHLLWVGCGREDFLFEANQRLLSALKEKHVRHMARITSGSHNWRVWRRYLNEVLPLLFHEDN